VILSPPEALSVVDHPVCYEAGIKRFSIEGNQRIEPGGKFAKIMQQIRFLRVVTRE
jgi:hypothetical protein